MNIKKLVNAGKFYGRRTAGGELVELPDEVGRFRDPDEWICRRVEDFPRQQVPTGGLVAACSRCAAAIVYNPARTVQAPKVCMQCASVRPLPIEESH